MERLRRNHEVRHTRDADREPVEAQGTTQGESPADPPPETGVQVISGASVQTFPLGGLQVSHARTVLGTILRIDSQSPVLVNGRPVRPTHRLAGGDTLEFVHHAGEKGSLHGRAPRDRRHTRRR